MLNSNKIVSIGAQIIVHTHIQYLTFYGKKCLSLASSLLSMEKLRSTEAVVGWHFWSKPYIVHIDEQLVDDSLR